MSTIAKTKTASRIGAARRRSVLFGAGSLVAIAMLMPGLAQAADVPAASAVEDANGVVEVEFWHSMNNINGEVLQELVDRFNADNDGKIMVKPVYQGNYDNTISKFKASVQAGATPPLIQLYEIGTQFMVDSGLAIAAGAFAERDGVDLDYIQPTFRSFYTVNDQLWAIPMNGSVPVLYYNRTAFEDAGLDPDNPPRTPTEIRAAAEKLSSVNGGPVQYGFGAPMYSWLLEEFASSSGVVLCNPDNGRSGVRVTSVNFASEPFIDLATWWQQMVNDGLAANIGRSSLPARDAFKAGQTAMNLEATVTFLTNVAAAEEGGFELGVAAFPTMGDEKGFGPTIGGASLWMIGEGHSGAEAEGAWRFAHWFSQPDVQAYWHTRTGYYPTAAKTFEEPEEIAFLDQYPSFQIAIDSLNASPTVPATAGCAVGVMPQLRAIFEEGFERAVLGEDPASALDAAAEAADAKISEYNMIVRD